MEKLVERITEEDRREKVKREGSAPRLQMSVCLVCSLVCVHVCGPLSSLT